MDLVEKGSDPEIIESGSLAFTAAPLFSVPVSTATAAVSVEEPSLPPSAEPVVLTPSVADAKSASEVSVGSMVLSSPDWPETAASDVVPVLSVKFACLYPSGAESEYS